MIWRPRRRRTDDFTAEIDAHLANETEMLIREHGLSPDEARARARRTFGNVTAARERFEETGRIRWVDELHQDTRLALRALRHHPAFTLTAILMLGLGIGANTAIFSVFQAVLLRPLPYRDPGSLITMCETNRALNQGCGELTPANYISIRDQVASIAEAAVYVPDGVSLTGTEEAEFVSGLRVTANAFNLLGVPAEIGRTLLPADGDLASPPTILLSHTLWTRKFAADPTVIGRTLTLEGAPATVVGVMPAGFQVPGTVAELWQPIRYTANDWQQRSNHFLAGFGRLAPGASIDRARSEVNALARRLQQEFAQSNANIEIELSSLRETLSGPLRTAVTVLLAAVGLLLLIACANVTSLVLTRATAHRRDLALRAALGAGRGRLVRQQITEGLLLALLGGGAALLICTLFLRALRPTLPPGFVAGVQIDLPVLAFGLAIAIVTGLLCGTIPALLVLRRDLQGSLMGSSRSATASSQDTRARGLFVAAQVAMALVLLIGAGLLLKSFVRLLAVDTGLQADRVLATRLVVPRFLYPEQVNRLALYDRILDDVRRIPDIESAAVVTFAPFSPEAGGGSSWFTREGRPAPRPDELLANNRLVSQDYFRTLGIPLRTGRLFDGRDTALSTLVAIVNETMARRFWPGEDVVGKRFKFGPESSTKPWIEIVGMIGDVKQGGLDRVVRPEMYRPHVQDAQRWLSPSYLVTRSSVGPIATAGAVRRTVQNVDRNLPIRAIQPLADFVAASIEVRRVYLILVSLFASVALLLAAIGIYGVVAYTATQRIREMGIRVALGARRADVVTLMLRQGFRPVIAGVAIGLALAAGVTRYLSTLLYDVETRDVLTFAAVPLVMLIAAGLAAFLPARRAAAVDPVSALRME